MSSTSHVRRPAWIGATLSALGPSAPNVAAGVFAVGLLAQITYSVLTLRRTSASAPSYPAAAPSFDASRAGWHGLFGSTEVDNETRAAAANLLLRGTIAFPDPTFGFAIINVDGHAGMYGVGTEIGGARLRYVYADHVVLDRGGALETLAMAKPDRDFMIAGNATAPGRAGADANDVPIERPPSPAELRHRTEVATAPIATVIKAHPLLNGELWRALVVDPGPDRATFKHLGLRPGDQIMALNNMHVTPDTLGILAKYMKAARPIHLSVNRAGEGPIEITLNPDAVATAAME
jgi:type II secretion system protein C